jgi:hypothetical protein
MDIVMPAAFPVAFRDFGLATRPFFPKLQSDADLSDPLKRRAHLDSSWQAVRYRYRICAESNDEFRSLLANPSESWKAGWGDEELNYKLDRCVYTFFMCGVSVFDSFAFCIYFLGHAIEAAAFPDVANPRNITRKAASKAFAVAFPSAKITELLAGLSADPRFSTIDLVRNLVGHRVSGRRSVRSSGTRHDDGTYTTDWHEETWHVLGAAGQLVFDDDLLQRYLDDITALLDSLASAARDFAEDQQSNLPSV